MRKMLVKPLQVRGTNVNELLGLKWLNHSGDGINSFIAPSATAAS